MNENIFNVLIKIFINSLKNDYEINQLIIVIKELFYKNINNSKELSKQIDQYLLPHDLEKKENAEISTPYKLRKNMLDKIPIEFWSNKNHKVFEPCSGKGGFVLDIINRFNEGLKKIIYNDEERYKWIIENCIYFSDINSMNIFITKLLIDPKNKYNINCYEGNTLELNIKNKWNLDGFNAVIGNPPYQNSNNNKGIGNILWNIFVEKSLKIWLHEKGLLLFIHPRGWRQVNSKIGNFMKTKQINYLNMNNLEEGLKVFNCSTDFDYYLIENTNSYKNTIVNDYKNNEFNYNINNLKFIPNHSFNNVFELVHEIDNNGFICSKSVYETRRKWMSKYKDETYKYPCVYSINSKNEISKKWSSRNNNGHFGISKFIFSNGNGFYKDYNGEYGLTEWAYAIQCNKEDMNNVEKIYYSEKFKNIIDSIHLTSNKYNYNILKLFKKDFWKDFLK